MKPKPSTRKRPRDEQGSRASDRAVADTGQPAYTTLAQPALSSSAEWTRALAQTRCAWSHGWQQAQVGSTPAEAQRRRAKRTKPMMHTWCPYPPSAVDMSEAGSDTPQYDRFDIAGTTSVNELVLRHAPLPASAALSAGRTAGGSYRADSAAYFEPVRLHGGHDTASSAPSPVAFALHRYTFNLIKALVHPLHNYLQLHHGLHNADEIQIMLMPKRGPLAEADQRYRHAGTRARPPLKTQRKTTSASTSSDAEGRTRHCYIATNQETLSADVLEAAVRDWRVPSVFQIDGFSLVHGRPGRHAELKLAEFLHTTILHMNHEGGKQLTPAALQADEKALITGERLPCAVCRLVLIPFEPCVQVLPSHGHVYMTAATTELLHSAGEENSVGDGEPRRSAPSAAAAKCRRSVLSCLLMSPQRALEMLVGDAVQVRSLHASPSL